MPALMLMRFDTPASSEQPVWGRSRTSEIRREYIPGYPRTLFIYRLTTSLYWWVRFYIAGKTLRETSKQTGKREATSWSFPTTNTEQIPKQTRFIRILNLPEHTRDMLGADCRAGRTSPRVTTKHRTN